MVVGVITNNSVEATVRMAGNLGFAVYLVAYGCFIFGRTDWNGTSRNAEDVRPLSFTRPPSENFDRFIVLPRPTILAASRGSQAEAAGRMFSAML